MLGAHGARLKGLTQQCLAATIREASAVREGNGSNGTVVLPRLRKSAYKVVGQVIAFWKFRHSHGRTYTVPRFY
jgi:hypothetical protein